jgi:probable rRNA maturation factor
MPYRIHLRLEPPYARHVQAARLRAAARAALRHQAAPDGGELTIVVTGDEALRTLNRDFLGEDRATDVLSFPSEETDPETGARYFGDIAISYPKARAQAQTGKHPVWAELQLLVVHGVLHLLGHDHAEPADHAQMWAAQGEVLKKLKTPIRGPANIVQSLP